MDASKTSPRMARVKRGTQVSGITTALLAAVALAAPAAQGMAASERATSEVQKWTSPQSFDAPYAFVEVIHDGRHLDRTAMTRCKGQFADKDLTVQISTCGHRWRVRAAYVSMNGRGEDFRIVYSARDEL